MPTTFVTTVIPGQVPNSANSDLRTGSTTKVHQVRLSARDSLTTGGHYAYRVTIALYLVPTTQGDHYGVDIDDQRHGCRWVEFATEADARAFANLTHRTVKARG